MAKAIMIQGTMSNAGKSILCAALCRIFVQDGYRVAPFKSQNMALNSFITEEGLEMGRAQVVQAIAAKKKPSALMNPILLKPTSDTGSQVIIKGKARGNMSAREYFSHKTELIPDIMECYDRLSEENDIIVIEGAGSPVEINLKENDIVNMGMAKMAKAPVLLAGDIDRGGVFAQLYGTVMLFDDEDRKHLKGLIINKFRGDVSILEPGIRQLENLCHYPVIGTVPYMNVDIEDEDSLTDRFHTSRSSNIDVAVIRTERMSNYTDFTALEACNDISVRYVRDKDRLGEPDVIILPGSKNTISDMMKLRENGMEARIKQLASRGTLIFGICGGYQMLGRYIDDTTGAEYDGVIEGMGLLDTVTVFAHDKYQKQTTGRTAEIEGAYSSLSDIAVEGYEIHMGKTTADENLAVFDNDENDMPLGYVNDNVAGTYLHGIFDSDEFRNRFIDLLYERKGLKRETDSDFSYEKYREQQLDLLADHVRAALDMDMIYRIIEEGV